MTERESGITIPRNTLRWLALGIGVIALIALLVAIVATPGEPFNALKYVTLGLSIVGILGFVLLDPDSLVQAITGRTGQHSVISALITIAFIALVVAIYVIMLRLREAGEITPLDLTEANEYEVSQATIDLLEGLEDPIEVTAFIAQNDPDGRDNAQLWLSQYQKYSNGLITYDFVDPDLDPIEAQRLEVTTAGAIVFEQGDRTATASFADESNLTNAIVQVLLGDQRVAYFVTGHGERGQADFAATGFSDAASMLQRSNFTVNDLNLLTEGEVPADADLVIIAGPTAQFSQTEVEALDAYLQSGGAAMILAEPTSGGATVGGVVGADISSDGNMIATAGADGTARVFDLDSGDELAVMRGHTSDVVDVAFSPDGETIVTIGADGTVRVWDVASGDEITQLQGQVALAQRIAYSPDGSLIATMGQDQLINVWDADTYEPHFDQPLVASVPLFVGDFSDDGRLLAVGGGRQTQTGGEGVVTVWDMETGEQIVSNPLHTNVVFDLVLDGDEVYTACVDGTIGTLNIDTGEGSTENLFPGLGVTGIGLLDDDVRVYALGDGTVHVVEEGQTPGVDDTVLAAHTDLIWDMDVAPDGETFLTASRDGDVAVWQLGEEEPVLRFAAHSILNPLYTYLTETWGISVNDDLVIDAATATEFNEAVPVVTTYDTTSPITRPLSGSGARTFFPLARSISAVEAAPPGVSVRELMFTTDFQGASWGETTDPMSTGGGVAFDAADNPGPVALAVSATISSSDARLFVAGDADFASNDAMAATTYGNSDLFRNAANWLTEAENAIDLPAPDFAQRTWDQPLTQAGLIVTWITVTCLLPAAVLAMGVFVWTSRRRRR